MIVSARLIVDRRCAMEIVVLLPRRRFARAELTRVSDSASKADVAKVYISKLAVEEVGISEYLHLKLKCLVS